MEEWRIEITQSPNHSVPQFPITQSPNHPITQSSNSQSPNGIAQPSTNKKELRQQRAAERAKYAPRLRELKQRIETAERKIDELQKNLDVASEELFNPKPTTNFEELNRTVRTLQFEIDRYTADWEEAATELEAIESENAARSG